MYQQHCPDTSSRDNKATNKALLFYKLFVQQLLRTRFHSGISREQPYVFVS
jgi:hypothetical protein